MGEVTVEADRDPVTGYAIHHGRDHEVVPAEAPVPGNRDRRENGEERNSDEGDQSDLLELALALELGLLSYLLDRRRVSLDRGVRGGRTIRAEAYRGDAGARGGSCHGCVLRG